MLEIPFNELPGCGPQDMFARDGRAARQQGAGILQLIAEAIGATGLVEARSCPHAAGKRLIEQPAIDHDIKGPVGRLHADCAKSFVPVASYIGQNTVNAFIAVARDQGLGVSGAGGSTEHDHHLSGAARFEREGGLQGAAWIEASTGPV